MPPKAAAEGAYKAADKLSGTAGSILERKGHLVHSIGPGDSVYAAVEMLQEYGVGALFVVDGGKLVGVISERDYARKVILEGRASRETRVEEIMSSPAVSVGPGTSLPECMRLIDHWRIRHLAVVEADRLVGVISIGDIVRAIIIQLEQTIDQLNTIIIDPYPA
jgi:CBS domain-containing protein